jgi:hypothetical protein
VADGGERGPPRGGEDGGRRWSDRACNLLWLDLQVAGNEFVTRSSGPCLFAREIGNLGCPDVAGTVQRTVSRRGSRQSTCNCLWQRFIARSRWQEKSENHVPFFCVLAWRDRYIARLKVVTIWTASIRSIGSSAATWAGRSRMNGANSADSRASDLAAVEQLSNPSSDGATEGPAAAGPSDDGEFKSGPDIAPYLDGINRKIDLIFPMYCELLEANRRSQVVMSRRGRTRPTFLLSGKLGNLEARTGKLLT